MEKEYQKIGNVFKFDEKFRTIVGLNEPYETLKNIIWQGTEKIDGTNIRIHWDGHDITFAGHTDKSQLPENLKTYLKETFLTDEMEYVFEQIFGESEAYIFGEGFGVGMEKATNSMLNDLKSMRNKAENELYGFEIGGGISTGHYNGNIRKITGGVNITQNIYSQAMTAADVMEEALYRQREAILFGV